MTADTMLHLFLGSNISLSTLHSVLPPWDWDAAPLSDFPKAQGLVRRFVCSRWYKLAIYIIGFAAINMRSTIWHKSISMPVQFEKMRTKKKV